SSPLPRDLEDLARARGFDTRETSFSQGRGEGLERLLVAVDEEGARRRTLELAQVDEKLVSIRVRAEARDGLDLRLGPPVVGEDLVRRRSIGAAPAGGIRSHESDDGDRVRAAWGDVLQVMKHATAFAHPGSGDDDAGHVEVIERLRRLGIANVGEPRES